MDSNYNIMQELKRPITNEEFIQAEKREREEYQRLKFKKKIRVTSGGTFEDFDDLEGAIEYQVKMLRKFNYAAMMVVCPGVFELKRIKVIRIG